jgi:hypothetical protein
MTDDSRENLPDLAVLLARQEQILERVAAACARLAVTHEAIRALLAEDEG